MILYKQAPDPILITHMGYKDAVKLVNQAGRVSHGSVIPGCLHEQENFVKRRIEEGHLSVLEHIVLSFEIFCDRGISHELVRHRFISPTQSSTRYLKTDELEFIMPIEIADGDRFTIEAFKEMCKNSEKNYNAQLARRCSRDAARSVLPNCLMTKLFATANIREWRHFFKLRCSPAAHQDLRFLAGRMLELAAEKYPVFFKDIV